MNRWVYNGNGTRYVEREVRGERLEKRADEVGGGGGGDWGERQ